MTDYQAKRTKRIYEDVQDLPEEQREALVDKLIGLQTEESLKREKEVGLVMAADMLDEVEERYKNWGRVIGLNTGYDSLDKMTMGLAPGELIVVGGRTSSGKTALSINLAANILRQGKTVLFVTLEMTKAEVASRFRHIMGREEFYEVAPLLFFQESDELNWKSIDGLIEYARKDCNAELVVIDHLHYFTRELQNVAEDLGRITKEFKKNAIRHEVPVVLISHTKKGNNSTLSNDDLRGSSYIAQDADIVLMVSQDETLLETITVALTKNRNRHGVDIGTETRLSFIGTKIEQKPLNL